MSIVSNMMYSNGFRTMEGAVGVESGSEAKAIENSVSVFTRLITVCKCAITQDKCI